MTGLVPWFDRRFDFSSSSFGPDIHPQVRSRLRGTPARLEEIVHGLDAPRLTRRVDHKWSIQENAGHLLDLEPLWTARVDEFLSGTVATLKAADLTNRQTDEAGHNDHRLEDILSAFRARRAALLARVDDLPPEAFGRTAIHPRLQQPMRLIDHLFFVAEHDDHHLARIWELAS